MTAWLLLTFCALLVQAIFALFEMACVSFNKVRLQYYVSLGKRRALWIHFLLKRPSRLFGTTLLGINAALQIGSEASRRFYESIHIDPDFAPLTQVLLVVLLGELVPMTIARRHPERIAILLAPLMVTLAKLVSPITWAFDGFARLIHKLLSSPAETPLFLSREEVIMTFQEREFAEDEFNAIVHGVFQLKTLSAFQLSKPLANIPLFPTTSTVFDVRKGLVPSSEPFVLVYHRRQANIVSIVNVRDLFATPAQERIASYGKSPWFVAKETSILQILDQFRRNNQRVAVILDTSGEAFGILTLDQIIDAIFGPEIIEPTEEVATHFIDRTFDGSMLITDFNLQCNGDLPEREHRTLGELVLSHMDHPPSRGEMIRIGRYEITVLEPTLKGAKLVNICTLQE
jgi:putative hemolysin